MSNIHPRIERRFVATRRARIHVAMIGSGAPLLLLHQTPRSWDEFRDALPQTNVCKILRRALRDEELAKQKPA